MNQLACHISDRDRPHIGRFQSLLDRLSVADDYDGQRSGIDILLRHTLYISLGGRPDVLDIVATGSAASPALPRAYLNRRQPVSSRALLNGFSFSQLPLEKECQWGLYRFPKNIPPALFAIRRDRAGLRRRRIGCEAEATRQNPKP